MKELKVNAIRNGTVIDHISTNTVFAIVKILKLAKLENEILLGKNLTSKNKEKKGIIKISDKFFSQDEINKIAILSPKATLNIIKDYKVIEKKQVKVPDNIHSIVKCVNPNCITNNDTVPTKFDIINKKEIRLKCNYCEKITDKKNLTIL